jgi:hypothetical protein
MNEKSDFVEFNGEILFVYEGKISNLHIAKCSVILLEKIQGNIAAKNLATGIIAALSDMQSVLANSSMLGMYEGEDMYSFIGNLDDKVLLGSFAMADKIKNGDNLRIIASKRGGAYFAHSLIRLQDDLLMLPLMVFAGRRSFFKSCMKFSWNFCVFTWLAFFLGTYFMAGPDIVKSEDFIFFVLILFLVPVLLWFPSEYMTYRNTKFYAFYASAIFTAYNFPRPDDLDVRAGMIHYPDGSYGFGGINCGLALAAHKKKYRM